MIVRRVTQLWPRTGAGREGGKEGGAGGGAGGEM